MRPTRRWISGARAQRNRRSLARGFRFLIFFVFTQVRRETGKE